MATIKVRQSGPHLVDGDDVMPVDWNGAPYQIPRRPFARWDALEGRLQGCGGCGAW